MGRRIPPLSDADREALKTYPWPGNVRELRNVIERALITSRDGRLHLSRGLPAAPPPPGDRIDAAAQNAPEADAVLTEARMRAFERDNMIRALEGCGWRVGGPGGAADALGVSASTFKSRMKALGVERPG
jgi:DNA-binding NtrC family response regulator